ncbi:MAG: 3-deoxy-8-phosphooctulonate synthase [Planctomycetota bacterium]|nr:3-deoxy-8-phosphooctulonate synthase [Planctomycetota bacterium]
MKTREIPIGDVRIGGGNGFVLISGPCVIESPEKCLEHARLVKEAAAAARVPLIFKASFDKANRSSATSFRGVGMKTGIETFKAIKKELKLPILTDIHEPAQCDPVAEVVDVLQIPALLCRQTDLLLAAGQTGKPVNVKKGQFLAPGDMRNVVDKIKSTDNEDIILTERGTTFGYHYLVSDMRSMPSMRKLGYPVVFDATHSVQLPGGAGNKSGGERHFVAPLARAAMAAGVDGLFMEVHPDPDAALSDGPNSLRTADLTPLLHVLKRIDEEVRAYVQAEEFDLRPPRPGAGNTLMGAAPRATDD